MRRTHHTILLVGEGQAEIELAKLVRDLFLPRNCGTVLQHQNAGGYGGAAALTLAIAQKKQTEYDAYAVLIDTDQHWSDAERQLARDRGIVAIESAPCLEAVLLQADGKKPRRQTRDNKAAFEEAYGSPAHRHGVLQRHFTRETFESSRRQIQTIADLLALIRC
jgi:hypothetical protein